MFDDLIEKALLETNIKNQEKIYFDIQKLAMDWAVDIFQAELLGRHYEQRWLVGWFNNPAYPGEYFYWYRKGVTTAGASEGTAASQTKQIYKSGALVAWVTVENLGPSDVELICKDKISDSTKLIGKGGRASCWLFGTGATADVHFKGPANIKFEYSP
jgi:hypothetical protein